ncbi:hypothetical protein Tco_0097755 [Tanacetum coccineum]
MVDSQLSTRLEDSIKKTCRSYTAEFEKKAQDERKRYIDLVEKSMKDIIKNEVKNQLPHILPKEVFEFATPVIQSTTTESLENVLDKDLFESYDKAYLIKRDRENKDKDEDPLARSHQGLKRRKTSKDVEPSKGSKSKESKSTSSKGTKSQPKSSGKSTQAEESVFETAGTEMPQNQGSDLEKSPLTFDELMSTPIDFLTYVMNNLKIDNLTQEHLVSTTFNHLKGTYRSRVELEYHFDECYNIVTDRLDWNNPKGQEYPFELSKPLPLIEYRGRQVVPFNYLINNDLEYLKGGSSRRKYTTSTKKPRLLNMMIFKASKTWFQLYGVQVYKHDVYSSKRIIAVTKVKVMKWYDYSYLEEIVVRREYQKLYKFKEGDFPRLNLRDVEDMMILLVQKKVANLEKDVIFELNVALRMFTRRVIILKRVKDLQLGVESYQKKLNITKPKTFRSDISKRTPYTTYNNPQGIIYVDKFKRNRLMRLDKLYKFSDGALTFVQSFLHHIASNLRMDYFPKRRWSNFDKQRSRIMIKEIDKLQLERRVMRNLEKFVGGREYGEDFWLLERII